MKRPMDRPYMPKSDDKRFKSPGDEVASFLNPCCYQQKKRWQESMLRLLPLPGNHDPYPLCWCHNETMHDILVGVDESIINLRDAVLSV